MARRIVAGGIGQGDLVDAILADLKAASPAAVGIASAYVTVSGVNTIRPVLMRAKVKLCRLVAGLDDEITHPEALRIALSFGWVVRLARAPAGRFHPKLIVGGARFDPNDVMTDPSFVYVGSGNLTWPGLKQNTECAMVGNGDDVDDGASAVFAELWKLADVATPDAIKNYAAIFAEENRRRRPEVLEALGVAEDRSVGAATVPAMRATHLPRDGTVSEKFAAAAWAGLQSFTGEYTFQVEFPRAAGEVVRRLAGAPFGMVGVLCTDGLVRPMRYKFYADNGMFRLNIPNDVPGVTWARANRDGIAIVSYGPVGGAALRLALLPPGPEVQEVLARSYALNTWGRTPTRLYGWF